MFTYIMANTKKEELRGFGCLDKYNTNNDDDLSLMAFRWEDPNTWQEYSMQKEAILSSNEVQEPTPMSSSLNVQCSSSLGYLCSSKLTTLMNTKILAVGLLLTILP